MACDGRGLGGGGRGHTQEGRRTVVGRASMRRADWASHSWLVSMYGMAVLFFACSGVQGIHLAAGYSAREDGEQLSRAE